MIVLRRLLQQPNGKSISADVALDLGQGNIDGSVDLDGPQFAYEALLVDQPAAEVQPLAGLLDGQEAAIRVGTGTISVLAAVAVRRVRTLVVAFDDVGETRGGVSGPALVFDPLDLFHGDADAAPCAVAAQPAAAAHGVDRLGADLQAGRHLGRRQRRGRRGLATRLHHYSSQRQAGGSGLVTAGVVQVLRQALASVLPALLRVGGEDR